jgi:hypothetical protein
VEVVSLDFCVVFGRSMFFLFRLAIVLSVLRFLDSDIFKLVKKIPWIPLRIMPDNGQNVQKKYSFSPRLSLCVIDTN